MQSEERTFECPYCGEEITILVDPSAVPQEYIEDCQVCCHPIEIVVKYADDGKLTVSVRDEDEPRSGN